jgi:hypothetical protein
MDKSNKNYINGIVDFWKDVLDEGATYKSEKIRRATAIMLNNEATHLNGGVDISEAVAIGANSIGTAAGVGTGYGTPGTIGSGEFHKIAIPMVRRTFPELIAHDIVGVQPLTGPVGLAFALRFRGSSTYDAGAESTTNPVNKDSYGNTITNEIGYNAVNPYYSGDDVRNQTLSAAAGEALGSDATVANRGLGIGTNQEIAELSMTIEKAQVEAKTRKLRSRWSMEVAQDLKAMHGLNLEEEMMDVLAYEITAEIDRELIAKIRSLCTVGNGNVTTLDFNSWGSSGADFNGRWEAEVYRNLYNYVIRKTNRIAVTTRRGAGNYAVCSPNMVAALEATSAFTIAPVSTDINSGVTGVSRVGSLDGRLNVYRDTFHTTANDSILIGYKGPSEYDTGVVYLPYIQLMASKATYEDSFQPTVGLMSRYAIHEHMFGSQNFYQTIVVNNFD